MCSLLGPWLAPSHLYVVLSEEGDCWVCPGFLVLQESPATLLCLLWDGGWNSTGKDKETEAQRELFFPEDKGSGISFLSTLPPAAALERRAPGHTGNNVFRQSSLL